MSGTAKYTIGMLITIMAFTYLTAQLEGNTNLIVIGDIILIMFGILGGILISKQETKK